MNFKQACNDFQLRIIERKQEIEKERELPKAMSTTHLNALEREHRALTALYETVGDHKRRF